MLFRYKFDKFDKIEENFDKIDKIEVVAILPTLSIVAASKCYLGLENQWKFHPRIAHMII